MVTVLETIAKRLAVAKSTIKESPQLPYNSKWVAAGDSITDLGFHRSPQPASANDHSGTGAYLTARGYWGWAQWLSGARLLLTVNSDAGVAGNTSTHLLTRYGRDVIAATPKLVSLQIGTNDVAARIPPPVCLANVAAMIAQNRAIGAFTILVLIPPRGTVASPMTGEMLQRWIDINAGFRAMAADDVRIVDLEPFIGAADANHTIKPGHTADGLHLSYAGAYFAGMALAPTLAQLVASNGPLSGADNAVANGFFSASEGTGRIVGSGGSGVVPDGYTLHVPRDVTGLVSSVVVDHRAGFGNAWQIQAPRQGNRDENPTPIVMSTVTNFETVLSAGSLAEVRAVLDVAPGLEGVRSVAVEARFPGAECQMCGSGLEILSGHQTMPSPVTRASLRSAAIELPTAPGIGLVRIAIDRISARHGTGTTLAIPAIRIARLGCGNALAVGADPSS